jgi:hypothetical protein
MGVQEARWEMGDSEPAGDYTFLCGNGNVNDELGTGFFIHEKIISAFKELNSNRMYVT